jgi:hypothetical protein
VNALNASREVGPEKGSGSHRAGLSSDRRHSSDPLNLDYADSDSVISGTPPPAPPPPHALSAAAAHYAQELADFVTGTGTAARIAITGALRVLTVRGRLSRPSWNFVTAVPV